MKHVRQGVAAWTAMALAYLLMPGTLEAAFDELGMFGRWTWTLLEAGLHILAAWFAIGTLGAVVFLASGLCHRRTQS